MLGKGKEVWVRTDRWTDGWMQGKRREVSFGVDSWTDRQMDGRMDGRG